MIAPAKKHILVVEDDEAIAAGLSLNLKLEGYSSEVAEDGVRALDLMRSHAPDLILLDISMPNKDGLELLSELRQGGDLTPVIVLSAREGEYDKVAALRLGADDYVTKPFALAELMARVTAVLRRVVDRRRSVGETRCFGEIEVDTRTRTLRRNHEEVKLTHLEFELLLYFMNNAEKVLTRQDLLREVWGMRSSGSQRTVDNFVAQLRSKLEPDPEKPEHLITVRGSGYRFDP
jgi:two-component system response regulator VicR